MSARLFTVQDWEKLAIAAGFKPSVMADLAGMTLRQMERRFTQEFQLTPTEWIRHLRCRMAMEFIKQGFKNSAIVIDLKFGNESQLCHDFKRVSGASPQSFARIPGQTIVSSVPIRVDADERPLSLHRSLEPSEEPVA